MPRPTHRLRLTKSGMTQIMLRSPGKSNAAIGRTLKCSYATVSRMLRGGFLSPRVATRIQNMFGGDCLEVVSEQTGSTYDDVF